MKFVFLFIKNYFAMLSHCIIDELYCLCFLDITVRFILCFGMYTSQLVEILLFILSM